MGRKNKYETEILPRLSEITKLYQTCCEAQIAKKLGIAVSTFEKYKAQHKELRDALQKGKEQLADDLKDCLRKKAKGFYYTETKRIYLEDGNGKRIGAVKVEETEKYAAPDTGAIHLLLKNIDKGWRNDDQATLDLKREKIELDKKKAESEIW